MDGPQHYREAEMLLEAASRWAGVDDEGNRNAARLATAQVHALLALTAATAESRDPDGVNVADWAGVLGGPAGRQ